jgi:hypothetical protein
VFLAPSEFVLVQALCGCGFRRPALFVDQLRFMTFVSGIYAVQSVAKLPRVHDVRILDEVALGIIEIGAGDFAPSAFVFTLSDAGLCSLQELDRAPWIHPAEGLQGDLFFARAFHAMPLRRIDISNLVCVRIGAGMHRRTSPSVRLPRQCS